MPANRIYYKFISHLIIGFGVLVCAGSVWGFPYQKTDLHFIALTVATIFLGAFFSIQLPRTKLHITGSEGLIFFSLIIYGYEAAVFLAVVEAINGSISLMSKGFPVKSKTLVINAVINAISAFAGGKFLLLYLNGQPVESVIGTTQSLITTLCLLLFVQFIFASLLVTFFSVIRTKKPFWKSWQDYGLNTFAVYSSGAIIAGLMYVAIQKFDLLLVLITAVFAAIIYLTYNKYAADIRATAAKAEQAERMRAEQAENHVTELKHYISELEKSGFALQQREEQFRHAAFHDSLTALPNRSFFSNQLKVLINSYKEKDAKKFAVLFLDLNRFKTVNDSLGHSVGDLLLVNVAKRLQSVVRKGDEVARFGGDEFAVILGNVQDVSQVIKLVERIQTKLSTPFNLNGRRIFSSSSIGIALSNPEYENADDILRDADIAMYNAKEKGESYAIFDQAMHTKVVGLMQTESDLRYAIERDEFCLHYQPIIDLSSTELIGFEALIRWNHPERGMVSPAEFIPLSEDTGLVIPMTFWVIREVCKQLNNWQKQSPFRKLLTISVNISGKHFAEPDLVSQIRQILDETAINPLGLKLEITESSVMANAESAIEMLKELKALGLQLSIDDFGTGYSSLSYLHRFPTDTLKVDRSFVNKMEVGGENREIVKTIVSLAKALNMKVVAEGIETVDQYHLLKNLNCEYGQGFLFSRPVPEPEAKTMWLAQKTWKEFLPLNADYTDTQYQTATQAIS
jgi:diguanylate cyclase (GGDEF)-like protein